MIERIPHVGELVLRVSGATPEAVYGEALRGLGQEVVTGPADLGDVAAHETRELELESSDADTLLADLLNEALFVVESEGMVPVGLEVSALAGGSLRGRMRVARPAAPPRHVVKAATYHDLSVRRTDDGWEGRVVLDV